MSARFESCPNSIGQPTDLSTERVLDTDLPNPTVLPCPLRLNYRSIYIALAGPPTYSI
jgi:hypothetical protein